MKTNSLKPISTDIIKVSDTKMVGIQNLVLRIDCRDIASFRVKSYVNLKEGDVSDETFAKKVLMAKLERAGYKRAVKLTNHLIKAYNDCVEKLFEFNDKALNCIAHDNGYIVNITQ